MKKITKLSVLTLLVSLCSCSTSSPVDLKKNAPDYSSSEGEFITFAYASPTNGRYVENGITYSTGEDYRTVERYKEYKAAGLNTMLIQGNDPYNGEDWETSQLKKDMDMCKQADIERCIVFDSRIQALSTSQTPIVGEGCRFATQDDLVEYVRECMKDYSEHPVFYGVMIMDEPTYKELEAFGAVYRAIKAVKDCYIEANLLPYQTSSSTCSRYSPNYASETPEESYRYYVNQYIHYAQPDKILMDSYPMRMNGDDYFLVESHLKGLQILAGIAKENHIAFEAVAQTFAASKGGAQYASTPNEANMSWQLNAYMGFGVQTFGYFTYWRKQDNNMASEWYIDGTSYISQFGNKTPLYYTMETLHSEMQAAAKVLANYSYVASNTYIFPPVSYSTGFANIDEEDFSILKKDSVSANDGSVALITELKDSEKNQTMYMVMNAMDPDYKKEDDSIVMDISLNFGSEYNAVEVLYRGEIYYVALSGGVYQTSIDAGYAQYVMPYKA